MHARRGYMWSISTSDALLNVWPVIGSCHLPYLTVQRLTFLNCADTLLVAVIACKHLLGLPLGANIKFDVSIRFNLDSCHRYKPSGLSSFLILCQHLNTLFCKTAIPNHKIKDFEDIIYESDKMIVLSDS